MSRTEPATDDLTQPLSSTTARARQATVAPVTAECDAAHVAAVSVLIPTPASTNASRLSPSGNRFDLPEIDVNYVPVRAESFVTATTTIVGTTVGNPTLASLALMPHNIYTALQAALRLLALQPTRFPAAARRTPGAFVRHLSPRYAVRVRSQLQPQRPAAGKFPDQPTRQRRYAWAFHLAGSTQRKRMRPMQESLRPRRRRCPITARTRYTYRF